jgi:hypothetical protein
MLMRLKQLYIGILVTALLVMMNSTGWAAFGEDVEKPKPEFYEKGDGWVAKLIPRGKSTSIEIGFHASSGALTKAGAKEFDEASKPQVDSKTFRSDFFSLEILTDMPGAEAEISVSSDYFTSATQLWAPKEKGSSIWEKVETKTTGPVEGMSAKTKILTLSVKDGGVLDADGMADGRIELILAPQDSFWGYAMGTLVIRFFGVFLVLAILMIGMSLSGKFFESMDLKKRAAVPAPMPAPAPVRHEPEVVEPEPVPVEEIPADVAAAIGLGIHLYTNGGRNLRLSDDGMKAAAVGLALHLQKTSGTEV